MRWLWLVTKKASAMGFAEVFAESVRWMLCGYA